MTGPRARGCEQVRAGGSSAGGARAARGAGEQRSGRATSTRPSVRRIRARPAALPNDIMRSLLEADRRRSLGSARAAPSPAGRARAATLRSAPRGRRVGGQRRELGQQRGAAPLLRTGDAHSAAAAARARLGSSGPAPIFNSNERARTHDKTASGRTADEASSRLRSGAARPNIDSEVAKVGARQITLCVRALSLAARRTKARSYFERAELSGTPLVAVGQPGKQSRHKQQQQRQRKRQQQRRRLERGPRRSQ